MTIECLINLIVLSVIKQMYYMNKFCQKSCNSDNHSKTMVFCQRNYSIVVDTIVIVVKISVINISKLGTTNWIDWCGPVDRDESIASQGRTIQV